MKKFAVLVAQTNKGKLEVIGEPTEAPEELFDQIRSLTDANGAGKYSGAAVLHSIRGIIKKRKFVAPPAKAEKKTRGRG